MRQVRVTSARPRPRAPAPGDARRGAGAESSGSWRSAAGTQPDKQYMQSLQQIQECESGKANPFHEDVSIESGTVHVQCVW